MKFKTVSLDLAATRGEVNFRGQFINLTAPYPQGVITIVDEDGNLGLPLQPEDTYTGDYNRFRVVSTVPTDVVYLKVGTGKFNSTIKGSQTPPLSQAVTLDSVTTARIAALLSVASTHQARQINQWLLGGVTGLGETWTDYDNLAGNSFVGVLTPGTTGTGTATVTLEGGDSFLSPNWYTILQSVAIPAQGSPVVLRVHPDLAQSNNLVARDIMPRVWRWTVAKSDGSIWTGSKFSGWVMP